MTDLERTFLQLATLAEKQQENLNITRDQLTTVMNELKVNTYIQDPETKLVYKVFEPTGTFMYYKKIDYKRTAKEGEKGGSVLAKSEAMGMGYVLK